MRKREYSPDDLALFAQYRGTRAMVRPAECDAANPLCWVAVGPPAYTTLSMTGNPAGKCLGCGGKPLVTGDGPVHPR